MSDPPPPGTGKGVPVRPDGRCGQAAFNPGQALSTPEKELSVVEMRDTIFFVAIPMDIPDKVTSIARQFPSLCSMTLLFYFQCNF